MDDEKKQQSRECIHDDNQIFSTQIPLLFDRNRANIESHQLVWLDTSHEDSFILHQLRTVVDYVKTFVNSNQCQKYIESTSDTTTFLITSGLLGQQILPHIHQHDHIKSVYIFCENKRYHQQWFSRFSKVKHICTEFNELFNVLSQDVNGYLKRHHQNQRVDFQLVDGFDNSVDSESFKWLSCLVDLLVWIPYPIHYQQQLIDALKTYYDGNPRGIAIVEEFEQTYRQDRAIGWYTRPTFIFSLLNRALRQRNIPVIFLFGFFLKDLYNQLKEEHEKYRVSHLGEPLLKVYRGQFISKYEVEKLNNIGYHLPLVINSFLSTTIDRDIAMLFLDPSHQDDESCCILFDIEINFDKPSRPFADITRFSHVPDEHEVLFSIGTLFEMQEMRYDESNRVWEAKLTLHDRFRLKDDATVMNMERQQLKEKLLDFIDIIFSATFEETHIIFEQIMLLFPSDKWISAIKYTCLAEKNFFNDNYNEALKYYQQAVHIWLDYSSDEQLNPLANIAESYEQFADCYRSMKKWTLVDANLDLAIHYYNLAIGRVEAMPLRKAFLYRKCARIYEEKSKINHRNINLKTAVEYYQKELVVLFEHSSSTNNDIGYCYTKLGACYRDNSDYGRAFECYESALDILLHEREPFSLAIYDLSQQLVEICSKENKPNISLMLKYQLLAHEHLLIAHSPFNHEWQRNHLAASHDKLANLYEASNQSHIASEHRLSAEKLKQGSKVPPT